MWKQGVLDAAQTSTTSASDSNTDALLFGSGLRAEDGVELSIRRVQPVAAQNLQFTDWKNFRLKGLRLNAMINERGIKYDEHNAENRKKAAGLPR